jgi:hypothetical protein
MAGELWVLWLCRWVRDGDLDELQGDRSGLIESGSTGGGPLIWIGGGWSGPVVALLASCRIDDVLTDTTILAGTHGGRCQSSGAVGMAADHELSCQKDG